MAGSHYDLLGVDPGASTADIRRAYRGLARRHHPDAQPSSDPIALLAAQRKMAAIAAAYSVLADPARRARYDVSIGVVPRPQGQTSHDRWRPLDHDVDDDSERFDRLGDDEPPPGPDRPSDLVMMVPATLAFLAVASFVVGVMIQSHRLWSVAIVLGPLAVASFLAAPLVSMLRSRTEAERQG